MTQFFELNGVFVKINVVLTVRETKSPVTTSEDVEEVNSEDSSEFSEEENENFPKLQLLKDPLKKLGEEF